MSCAAAVRLFGELCGRQPRHVVRAPGRVNLIGEHTDYNDGLVMPLAVDRAAWIALEPAEDGRVTLHSALHGETAVISLDDPAPVAGHWSAYPRAVARALRDAGHETRSWRGVATSEVPLGAGLSSSAAFELATARAFAAVAGWRWDPVAMARICQRAEHAGTGVRCGLMDQLASACGVAGCALVIDCRTGAVTPRALPPGAAVVVLDTGARRELAATGYDARRRECEEAARRLGVASLRDVPPSGLPDLLARLASPLDRRVRHVVSEIARVRDAAGALDAGDAVRLGALMDVSHASLRDDFAVSTPDLDAAVGLARRQPGCLGARLTGAGFGGCAVALVERGCLDRFLAAIAAGSAETGGRSLRAFAVEAVDGVSVAGEC